MQGREGGRQTSRSPDPLLAFFESLLLIPPARSPFSPLLRSASLCPRRTQEHQSTTPGTVCTPRNPNSTRNARLFSGLKKARSAEKQKKNDDAGGLDLDLGATLLLRRRGTSLSSPSSRCSLRPPAPSTSPPYPTASRETTSRSASPSWAAGWAPSVEGSLASPSRPFKIH